VLSIHPAAIRSDRQCFARTSMFATDPIALRTRERLAEEIEKFRKRPAKQISRIFAAR
jgi:hypothetical protein